MAHWRLWSYVGDQTYHFPLSYVLDPGQSVRVHSGPKALLNPPGDLLWTTGYIWDDQADGCRLYDASGNIVDEDGYY